jgi:hypothetical protein
MVTAAFAVLSVLLKMVIVTDVGLSGAVTTGISPMDNL